MEIYLMQRGQRAGPFAIEDINRHLAAGRLNPMDSGWSESSPGWKPLLSFSGVIMPGGASSSAMGLGYATPMPVAPIRYAGFWLRTLALLVDLLIVGALFVLIVQVFKRAAEQSSAVPPFVVILQVLTGFIYMPLLWSSFLQATFGQRICRLRVVRVRDRSRISLSRGVVRFLGMILSALIGGVGFLVAAFNERKRGLHDVLAGILVIRTGI
jgi:uncharacterized RDD family membrane protein YckC